MIRIALFVMTMLALAGSLAAQPDPGGGKFGARLSGWQEVPAVSTTGSGSLVIEVSPDATSINFELKYAVLEGDPTAAHIHFGQAGANGGIVMTLCGDPQPTCPASPATVTGSISLPGAIVGPTVQGIAAQESAEVLRAMRMGLMYVNVHTGKFPSGEIRGQIARGARRGAGLGNQVRLPEIPTPGEPNGPKDKVLVCHQGDTGWFVIEVAEPAARSHLAHGDCPAAVDLKAGDLCEPCSQPGQ